MKNDRDREQGDGVDEFDYPGPGDLLLYEPDAAQLDGPLFGLSLRGCSIWIDICEAFINSGYWGHGCIRCIIHLSPCLFTLSTKESLSVLVVQEDRGPVDAPHGEVVQGTGNIERACLPWHEPNLSKSWKLDALGNSFPVLRLRRALTARCAGKRQASGRDHESRLAMALSVHPPFVLARPRLRMSPPPVNSGTLPRVMPSPTNL